MLDGIFPPQLIERAIFVLSSKDQDCPIFMAAKKDKELIAQDELDSNVDNCSKEMESLPTVIPRWLRC